MLPLFQVSGCDIWDLLIQKGSVCCRIDIEGRDIGQPEAVIGYSGPDSSTGRRVPPVLYIALRELPGGVQKDLLTGNFGIHIEGCHHILQLISEPVGSPRLIEG